MNDFMLESLRELQTTLLVLKERANRFPEVQEGWMLEWALTETVTAYRNLREGRISWWDAVKVYQKVSNAQLACDYAVMEAQMADNYDWHMAKWAVANGVQP